MVVGVRAHAARADHDGGMSVPDPPDVPTVRVRGAEPIAVNMDVTIDGVRPVIRAVRILDGDGIWRVVLDIEAHVDVDVVALDGALAERHVVITPGDDRYCPMVRDSTVRVDGGDVADKSGLGLSFQFGRPVLLRNTTWDELLEAR